MRFWIKILLVCCGLFHSLYGKSERETAIFAGGSFFYLQEDFDELQGVVSTIVGYIGGTAPSPTYEDVSQGLTNHVEAVKVVYNPKRVTFAQLVNFYWKHIDPTRSDGQFCDSGPQFRPVIFYMNAEQKNIAITSRADMIRTSGVQPFNVDILSATTFYPAEDQYQKYYTKDPVRYRTLLYKCGRAVRLKELWGK